MAFTRVCVHNSGVVDGLDQRESGFAACLAAAGLRADAALLSCSTIAWPMRRLSPRVVICNIQIASEDG